MPTILEVRIEPVIGMVLSTNVAVRMLMCLLRYSRSRNHACRQARSETSENAIRQINKAASYAVTSHIPAFLRQHAHLLHGKGRKEDAPTVDNAGADEDDGNDSDFDRDDGVRKKDSLLSACLCRLFQSMVLPARIVGGAPACWKFIRWRSEILYGSRMSFPVARRGRFYEQLKKIQRLRVRTPSCKSGLTRCPALLQDA